MTVSSQTNNETFDGNGVTTVWDLPFRFFDNADIFVYLVDPATQTTTPLLLGVDYTLTGAGLPEQFGTAPGKIITFVPVASLKQLYVERSMAIEQLTDIVNQGRFFPEVHEDVFDRLTMLIQQYSASLSRALLRPIGKDYYDALGHRISNVGNPTADQDAVTKLYNEQYIAGLLSTFTGPLNNAANVMYIYPNGVARTVQTLADKTDPILGARGIGYSGWTVADALDSYGAVIKPGDGIADDAPKVQAALAASSRVFFPPNANGYVIKSNFVATLTKDTVIDFNGQLVSFDGGLIQLRATKIATGRTLSANAARAATTVSLNDTSGIQAGDLMFINTTIKPSSDWNDTKKDCVFIKNVAGLAMNIADPLNFGYTTADAGLTVTIYRPVKLTLKNANLLLIAADADPTPRIMIEVEGMHGLLIDTPTISGQLPFNRDANPNRVGIQILASRDVRILNPTYTKMSYQIGIYWATRYIQETNVTSNYSHHGHADVGDWSSDYRLKGLISTDSYQSMSTHPCFRAFAEDIDVTNDYGLSCWRVVGGGIKNGIIRSFVNDTAELPQYQNIPMNVGYTDLYSDADFYCDNMDFRMPARITKATFGVMYGRTVTVSNTKCNDIITSFAARGDVLQLILGPGNRIGSSSNRTPGSALTLCPARIDFDVPLDAVLISGVYHVDPRAQMVPHSNGRLACRGSVFTNRATASPVATTLRVHVNAFSDTSQANIVNGKIKLFSTVFHQSAGVFSTQEKHFNFSFQVQATSALYFPTVAVFTSGLSGQAGEGVVITISAPTFAGVSQLGPNGDDYIDIPITLTAAGTTPTFSLTYEIELDRGN